MNKYICNCVLIKLPSFEQNVYILFFSWFLVQLELNCKKRNWNLIIRKRKELEQNCNWMKGTANNVLLFAVEEAGGKCLPCIVDIRHEDQVVAAVEKAVKQFGGIDILVNNASAIQLTGTLDTSMKTFDLMNSVNSRGTYLWWVISESGYREKLYNFTYLQYLYNFTDL